MGWRAWRRDRLARRVPLWPGDWVQVWRSDVVRRVESRLSSGGAETLFHLEGDPDGLYWPRGALRAVELRHWVFAPVVGGSVEDGEHG